MSLLRALIYDQDSSGWLSFEHADDVLVADSPGSVRDVIDAVAKKSAEGCYAVGYVSYEAAGGFDASLAHHPQSGLPLAMFGIFDSATEVNLDAGACDALALSAVMPYQDFEQAMSEIKRYLQEGDSYQVNFTHRLSGQTSASPIAIFKRLFQAQPSVYAALIETEAHAICSVSPELFFETHGEAIVTEPMKGTRPRGRYAEEDERFRDELAQSGKDQAENLMIVDMIRNDLGRIADEGSVRVDELFKICKLPTVWQQVSRISARTSCSLGEIFSSMFPCASVTGAPRHRTMEIIRELETSPRGVYTGAIGLVKPDRRSRFSVAIRTLTLDKNMATATYGVGGGIVWDSDSADEWAESLVKGEVLNYERPDFQLLETMRFDPDTGIYLLDLHLARLKASVAYFDFQIDQGAIQDLLAGIESSRPVRLRLLLSADGSVQLEQHEMKALPEVTTLRLASMPVRSSDVFLFHKTTHRAVYESAMQDVRDCDDVILWNERGELTETTISNLYLEIDGELLTPALDSGLLAGTYRQMMLESGQAREAVLYKKDLERADKLYISNSVRNLVAAQLAAGLATKNSI